MSDLAAAAAALGLPEALVQRSAEARAAETGQSVDDLYTAWAGGEAAPAPEAPAAEPEPAPSEEPAPEAPDAEAPAAPTPVIETPTPTVSAEPGVAAPEGPYRPPILVGTRDNPMVVLAGVIGLFFIVVMVGLIGPSIPEDSPGARSSEIGFSDSAVDGQQIYLNAGCAACHTQMVRPVVADVGLGPVTLADTNQVLGTRRFGPDLADVGSRNTASQIEATIGGLGDHPALSLSSDDLEDLVSYLVESATSPPATDSGEEDS